MMDHNNSLGGNGDKKKKQPDADEEACKRSGVVNNDEQVKALIFRYEKDTFDFLFGYSGFVDVLILCNY
jgi:hypothetical protein